MFDVVSFLTRLPVKRGAKIEAVAAKSYLFPLAASFIGLVVGAVAFGGLAVLRFGGLAVLRFGVWGSEAGSEAGSELAALLVLLALYSLTGLLHLDGLADFFDGLMAGGGRSEKRRAMKDEKLGVAGLFAVVFVLLLNLFAVKTVCSGADFTAGFTAGFTHFYEFVGVFVVAEVSAKVSVNTCLFLGRRADATASAGSNEGLEVKGLGALFIKSQTAPKFAFALVSAVLVSLFFGTSFGVVVFVGVVVAFFVSRLARRNFGVVSGDVLGASNELARTATLLVLAILWGV